LTEEQVGNAYLLSLGVLVLICLACKMAFKEEKRLSWALGAVNAFLVTVVSVVFFAVRISDYKSYLTFESNGRHHFHGVDNVSALTCIWFGTSMLVDLLFGLVYYRKYLGFLTAYVHHTVFMWIVYIARTGDGLFTKCTPFAAIIVVLMIEELPTFLLALGTVFPSFRTDLGFGVSFGILRVALQGYSLAYSIYSKADTVVTVLLGLTFALHVHWFTAWATKYTSYKTKGKKKELEQKEKKAA